MQGVSSFTHKRGAHEEYPVLLHGKRGKLTQQGITGTPLECQLI